MDIVSFLTFFDDEEDEIETLISLQQNKKRKKVNKMFLNREHEGYFQILIARYLMTEHDKFVAFFRITPSIFYDVLNHIRDDITLQSYNRQQKPISAEEKLAIVMR